MKRLSLLFLLSLFAFSCPVHAADSSSFDPTKITVQSVSTSSIPVGTVIAWPSASWPSDASNWLECNGQAISSTIYPALVALVGSRVPDYRGIFLRGYGSQVSTHYGTVTHSSGSLGALQGDAIRNMKGRVVANPSRGGSSPSGPFYDSTEGWNNHTDTGSSGTIWFDASRATPTAVEIRPVNRSVRYLIRAK